MHLVSTLPLDLEKAVAFCMGKKHGKPGLCMIHLLHDDMVRSIVETWYLQEYVWSRQMSLDVLPLIFQEHENGCKVHTM